MLVLTKTATTLYMFIGSEKPKYHWIQNKIPIQNKVHVQNYEVTLLVKFGMEDL